MIFNNMLSFSIFLKKKFSDLSLLMSMSKIVEQMSYIFIDKNFSKDLRL